MWLAVKDTLMMVVSVMVGGRGDCCRCYIIFARPTMVCFAHFVVVVLVAVAMHQDQSKLIHICR